MFDYIPFIVIYPLIKVNFQKCKNILIVRICFLINLRKLVSIPPKTRLLFFSIDQQAHFIPVNLGYLMKIKSGSYPL